MLPLTEQELEICRRYDKYDTKIEDVPKQDLRFVLMSKISQIDSKLYDWLHDVEFTPSENAFLDDKEIVNYDHKTMILCYSPERPIRGLVNRLQGVVSKGYEKTREGKNIENFIPYGLEYLFHNKNPMKDNNHMEILEHIRDNNMVYIKTRVKFPFRDYRRYRHDRKNERVREAVIECFGTNNDRYKVKQKKYQKHFSHLIKQKHAPKAEEITMSIIKKMSNSVQSESHKRYEIIENPDGDSFVKLFELYEFTNKFVINGVSRIWVAKRDKERVWIKIRYDNYSRGDFNRSYELNSLYFKINKYGGIVKVEKNPFLSDEIKLERDIVGLNEEPIVLSSPKRLKDIMMTTKNNETEIIEETNYEFIKTKIDKETPEAREYHLYNEIDQDSYVEYYFAKYGDAWVSTLVNNPKVYEMKEVYALADKLSEDDVRENEEAI